MRRYACAGVMLVLVFVFCLAAPPVHGDTISLRWYMRWDQTRIENVAMPVKEAFEAQFPGVHIVIENNPSDYWVKLQTMVAGGVAPDVLYPATHYGFTLARAGHLLDIRPYMQRDGLKEDVFLPGVLDLYTLGATIWALPADWARVGVFFNENMFAANGLGAPAGNWTWNDFQATARRLTLDTNGDGKLDQFAIRDFTGYWPVMAWSFSGHGIYDDLRYPNKTLLNDAEIIEGIQLLADMRNRTNVIPTNANTSEWKDVFLAGVAGMEMTGHWTIPAYSRSLRFDWNVAPLPRGKVSVNRIDGSGYAISASTRYPQEAWEFVKFLAAPGGLGNRLLVQLQQLTPVVRSIVLSDAFLKPPGLEHLNKRAFLAGDGLYSMYEPLGPMYDPLNDIVKVELKKVWDGKQSAKEAVTKLEPVLNAKIQELKSTQ